MTPWFERLGALDALFLDLSDRAAHMHVGALMLFDGAAKDLGQLTLELRAEMDELLAAATRQSAAAATPG